MPKAQPLGIRLDRRAWTSTLRSAKSVPSLPKQPKHGLAFMLVPDPEGGGEAIPYCRDATPTNKCRVNFRRNADGVTSFECKCSESPPGDLETPGSSSRGPATIDPCLAISRGGLRCISARCSGVCELVVAERMVMGKKLYFAACRCTKK